jgi:hypothetical protein
MQDDTITEEILKSRVVIARRNLEPLGACVKQVADDEMLPFESNAIDLVVSRAPDRGAVGRDRQSLVPWQIQRGGPFVSHAQGILVEAIKPLQ